ncbi:conserved hypothetical protein [Ricinus communis]|uniref:Uncharacterized protein n=1 Tax=Ricinus communis TaxID=3988 RepID=B9T871_RICCO|nr:conserved hypothetical protein [Ricinus communis]
MQLLDSGLKVKEYEFLRRNFIDFRCFVMVIVIKDAVVIVLDGEGGVVVDDGGGH